MDKKVNAEEAKAWVKKHPFGAVILVIFGIIIFSNLFGGSSSSDSSAPSTPQPATASVGEMGYLRLPGNSDSSQVICLGATKDEYDQIGKALTAHDYIGILEIPGAFCVSNGTQVQVIDSSAFLKRVRIVKGVREVDADKVLSSGWVAMEWVVKN